MNIKPKINAIVITPIHPDKLSTCPACDTQFRQVEGHSCDKKMTDATWYKEAKQMGHKTFQTIFEKRMILAYD